jgi:predicted N-acetyltransferase YhbS
MTNTSVIRHLLEVPEVLPVLVRWFVEEWGPYYGPEGPGDAEADLRAARHRDQLPICLVALDAAGDVTGTVALRVESIVSHRHLTPWLAALLVAPEHRRRGIGSALVAAIEGEARRLGHKRLYVGTDESRFVERRGWRAFDQGSTLRGTTKVYALEL